MSKPVGALSAQCLKEQLDSGARACPYVLCPVPMAVRAVLLTQISVISKRSGKPLRVLTRISGSSVSKRSGKPLHGPSSISGSSRKYFQVEQHSIQALGAGARICAPPHLSGSSGNKQFSWARVQIKRAMHLSASKENPPQTLHPVSLHGKEWAFARRHLLDKAQDTQTGCVHIIRDPHNWATQNSGTVWMRRGGRPGLPVPYSP